MTVPLTMSRNDKKPKDKLATPSSFCPPYDNNTIHLFHTCLKLSALADD